MPHSVQKSFVQNIQSPYKIYIYKLPKRFNKDVLDCFDDIACYSLSHCGMGRELYNISSGASVRDSHMFSLEVVLHHKLMFSTYRTMDPKQANIFYIPAYVGLQCLCNLEKNKQTKSMKKYFDDLSSFLQKQPYYKLGKPHFSSIGKIQREMMGMQCPYLVHPMTRNITYLSIEAETFSKYLNNYNNRVKVISVPYPSYIHFPTNNENEISDITTPGLAERDVFIFVAAGRRRSNPSRNIILDQFKVRTDKFYKDYMTDCAQSECIDTVYYYTDECREDPKWGTVEWMMHSLFCLQPPGDSPTRKSFFDAILSGCIPVMFPYSNHKTPWPFMEFFNYSSFTVSIEIERTGTENVRDILKSIPTETITELHDNVKKVRQWFQYSLPDGSLLKPHDAMLYIFKTLGNIYNLKN